MCVTAKNTVILRKAPDFSGIYDLLDSSEMFFMDGELVGPGAWITSEEMETLKAQGMNVQIEGAC